MLNVILNIIVERHCCKMYVSSFLVNFVVRNPVACNKVDVYENSCEYIPFSELECESRMVWF